MDLEVENFYPTSVSQLKDSINESNAQSRVVSSVTQDIIQQTNAQSGLGRDYPAIKPLACIRAETIQLVCNKGTPSTIHIKRKVSSRDYPLLLFTKDSPAIKRLDGLDRRCDQNPIFSQIFDFPWKGALVSNNSKMGITILELLDT